MTMISRSPAGLSYTDVHIHLFETELGWMGVAHHFSIVQELVFGHSTRERAMQAVQKLHRTHVNDSRFARQRVSPTPPVHDDRTDDELVAELVERLQCYAGGDAVDFSDVTIASSHLQPFGRRVVAACRRILYGQTCSYGQLAAACGSPKAARAVGHVMATNRFPLIVPCHRVVAAGGALGGFSAPGGLRTKRKLLDLETAGADARR